MAGVTGIVLDMDGVLPMTAMLFMLGIGWNFGVVGASTLLSASVPSARGRSAEGFGEVSMGFAAGAGASVALGGFTTLSVAGAVVAALALLFVYRWADVTSEI